MRANKILTFIVILQGLILVGQWTGQSTTIAREARADVTLSNPSERQLAMVEELKSLNAKMDKLQSTLVSGDVR